MPFLVSLPESRAIPESEMMDAREDVMKKGIEKSLILC